MNPNNQKSLYRKFSLVINPIFLVVILSFPTNVFPQSHYTYKLRGNTRYEGITSIQTASLDMELKSFTINSSVEDVMPQDTIKLVFFNPNLNDIYIKIDEILTSQQYLMKPKKTSWQPGWNIFSDWPVSEVIVPKRINISNLGGFGSIDKQMSKNTFIVPVYITKESRVPGIQQYKFKFISIETFTIIRYKLENVKDNDIILYNEIRREFNAGTPIIINIDSKNLSNGEYKFWIYGKIKEENTGPERTYNFYHYNKL